MKVFDFTKSLFYFNTILGIIKEAARCLLCHAAKAARKREKVGVISQKACLASQSPFYFRTILRIAVGTVVALRDFLKKLRSARFGVGVT
ncbi:hypothetical protein [Helicobacter zhangjianzhongii]|uniref:Uncharacterized protein n=1 Tax=Helicobacter zhangjianzhongii TaxID=2974574 RepID=A0ACC6FQS6_9HELI|nr:MULTISPECIES: hypothetical protein [unclassified Helicobacter]MDL0079601.1 hypothetical protein [Helicobacter sp. CPD2-1]MDL0081500.1 hypothetical protein [Helicobacter sp. XJK30-2]